MSVGKSYRKGFRPSRLRGPGRDLRSCPNGRANCWCCSNPELVQYKLDRISPSLDAFWDQEEVEED